ncbi:11-oxo-beta-amyrin 30-oxidase-like [Coffea eugenioides]|uniref:11-oxo-beta-amyrin 30-oxidase-like n=1 Tax=Coffea eugenioides TaxID=49369 RepID=UPI000F614CFE|nr:11-oxo-beta-amyrin 30-oxidase-like [Coffea eugenioides]
MEDVEQHMVSTKEARVAIEEHGEMVWRLKEIDLETRAILRDVMSSSEKRMRVGEKGEDLLGIMMESKTKALQEKGNKENAGLTDDQVTMILNEVLRLYPPALWIVRSIYEETKVHNDPEIWGENAKDFNPERVANAAKKPPNSFLPFGLGPRIRIGQNFAMMEAKVAIALILQNFSFEISPILRTCPFSSTNSSTSVWSSNNSK